MPNEPVPEPQQTIRQALAEAIANIDMPAPVRRDLEDALLQVQRAWLTAEDACEEYNVTKSWIYRKTHRREIPHFKDGNLLRFRRADLDAYFDRHVVPVRTPVETLTDRLRRRRAVG